jgi:protein TonB
MLTVTAILLFVLLNLALTMDHAWSNATLPERNELVFEERHKGYGAYRLRQEYGHRLAVALMLTIGLLALLAVIPRMISRDAPSIAVPSPVPPDGVIVTLLPPPSNAPDAQPPNRTKVHAAPATPDATSLAVPVGPLLVPSPDTMQTVGPADPAPSLGNDGGVMGSGPASPGEADAGPAGNTDIWPPFTVDEPPEFPGGDAALAQWVRDHLIVPEDLAGRDQAYVQFTVDRDGLVKDAHAVSGSLASCKEAAERTVAHMPRWRPARMNGYDVPCRLTLPIRFEVR